jgi:hypothetical protein
MTGADNSTPLIPLAAFRGIIRRGAEGGLPTGRRTVGLKKRRVRWSVRRAVRSLWKPCGPNTLPWRGVEGGIGSGLKAKGAERTQPRNCTDRNHII